MNELIFVLLICPLLIFIVSVIGTRRTRTYYVMPIVTFASFLIVGVSPSLQSFSFGSVCIVSSHLLFLI